MKKSYIFIFLFLIFFIAFINLKASVITFALFILILILIYFAKLTKNRLLFSFVFFFAFANLIGVPHAIINSDSFQYSGWKAIKDFDFSYNYFARVYSVAFISILFICFFVKLIGRVKYLSINRSTNVISPLHPISNATSVVSNKLKLVIVSILISTVITSIIGFEYRIGLSGVEPERLPFKLVGIFHISRSLLLPFLLLWLFSRINFNYSLNIFLIISSLLIGVFSGSRGTTLFYLLPLIMYNWQKNKLITKVFKIILLIFAFLIPTASQAIYTLSPGLNWNQQLNALFVIGLDPYGSIQGSYYEFINQILGIAHRFYGFQDYVLASQYRGNISVWNLLSFIFSGNPDYLVKDVTFLLYGLKFPEGSSYGVAMGLIGLSIANFNSNILIALSLLFYIALLIAIVNKVLISFMEIKQLRSFFEIIYMASCLILSLILISGRLDFFYLVTFLIIIFRLLINFKYKKA